MTETEWRTCTDPQRMLKLLLGKVSDRKLRRIACGWVRQLWELLEPRGRKALEVTERYADGEATLAELAQAVYRVTELRRRSPARAAAAWAVFFAASNIQKSLADCLRSTRAAAKCRGNLDETDKALCAIVRHKVRGRAAIARICDSTPDRGA